MQNETQRLLTEAVAEIKYLRRENELQSARLSMFDNVMLLFKTEPAFPGDGMSPDLVRMIEKHLEALPKESNETHLEKG